MTLPSWLDWLPFGRVAALDPSRLSCSPDDLSKHYYLLDVRTESEWQQSHIEDSVNLPIHRFRLGAIPLESLDKPVLCICLSAHRSTPAVRKLRRAGIDAYELKGGMLNWWRLKLPTTKP